MAATEKRNRASLPSRLLLRLMSRIAGYFRHASKFDFPYRAAQHCPLRALTFAAMALPGLALQPACAAEGDAVTFQYGHYQEGARDLSGVKSKFEPVLAESIQGGVKFTVNDYLKGVFNFSQDTWSGASPIATAPSSARGNRLSTSHVMTGASMVGMHDHGTDGDIGATPVTPHEMTGASPYLYSSLKLDSQYRPLLTDADSAVAGGADTQLVHTMSSASRETRKQIDFKLSRELDEATVDVGGGISRERDFESLFGNLGGHWDFNQKLTSLNAGMSYTASTTNAVLDHDAVPHIYETYMYMYERKGNNVYNQTHTSSQLELGLYSPTLKGNRKDLAANVGMTQILNKDALIETSLGYTHSTGYLANPYKTVEVAFVDPLKQQGTSGGNASATYAYDAEVVALLEQRPDERNQGTLNLHHVRYIAATDAALHLNYRYFQDDWGIKAHTLGTEWVQPLGNGWTLSPKVRYYTQTAANFYTPYLTTQQGLFSYVTDPVNGPIYINTQSPNDGLKYFEDPTGTVTPPIDPNPSSRNYGNPVVGLNGSAVINQQTGLPVSDQTLVDALKQDTVPFDRKLLPTHYSSDARLSGFGTLSAGLTVSKQFSRGMLLEFGYERMKHAGSLKLGGGGEGSYADFSSYLLNVALKIDLDSVGHQNDDMGEHSNHGDHSSGDHANHGAHLHHTGSAPAGVMFDHMLSNVGDWMVGYRYMYSRQGGDMVRGGDAVGDYALINGGCEGKPCYVRPTAMTMHMHMLDIMYAPTDWLNLMLMPQFVEMNMSMRLLDGSPRTGGMDAIGMAITHSSHVHTSGGLGDTEMHALLKLFRGRDSEMHLGLGMSVPTGDVSVEMRDMMHVDMGFMDYGMQLGSGTWDFKPSLTYTGGDGKLQWGGQLGGTKRMGGTNKSGYALGDVIQSTAWGSYSLFEGMAASLRGVYTRQEAIKGAFNNTFIQISPGDYTGNYGGRFLDLGLGLSAVVKSGTFAGNRLSIEWLQPVQDNPNGHQLDRAGSLVFNWGVHL